MKQRLIALAFLLSLIALTRLIPWPAESTLLTQREEVELADGNLLQLFLPQHGSGKRVLLLVPASQPLIPGPLLDLVQEHGVNIGVLRLHDSCNLQQDTLQQIEHKMGGGVQLVAGLDSTAPLAWQWLSSQTNDQAQALTVGFNMSQRQCSDSLPVRAEHGHWRAVWNDNPDDASARLVRQQANAESIISAYGSKPEQLLLENLRQMIIGESSDLPVIEMPAKEASKTLAIFYSGDGGWRDLDRDVASELAKRQMPVVGVDSLRYFWQPKPPAQAATDLAKLMQQYRQRWAIQHFVLIGFSFGADALPAIYNRLPKAQQDSVSSLILLNPATSGSFEIHVQGWLGKANLDAPSGPELAQMPAHKLLCIFGEEDSADSGCLLSETPGEKLKLPGGHHYDYNYPQLAQRIIEAVKARQVQLTGEGESG